MQEQLTNVLEQTGLIITEDNGNFVVTPAGSIDLSKKNSGSIRSESPVSIRRSIQFFLSLSKNGEMFVSPSGEVDLSVAKAVSLQTSLIIRRNTGDKLIVSKDGDFKKVEGRSTTERISKLKRENSVVLASVNGQLKLANPEEILSPSGAVTIPNFEDPKKTHLDIKVAQNLCITIDDDGDLIVQQTENHNTSDFDQWIQLSEFRN